ncbi:MULTISPECIES: DUF898 family protein [unclassified Acinetobacter]|uniref:DUF898 family protein n=1 Tax=unclassified Acinetobacter TaxID=196816 RepID=UPI0035B8D981
MFERGLLFQAFIFKATWKKVTISNSELTTDISVLRFTWIGFSNNILRILSLGLLQPWCAVRMYRYKLESLSVNFLDNPDTLQNQLQNDPNALAEEISDIFDFDISL